MLAVILGGNVEVPGGHLAGGTFKHIPLLAVRPRRVGTAPLDSVFPVTNGSVPTPWVAYPDRYAGSCQTADGASWLQVAPAAADGRTAVTDGRRPAAGVSRLGPVSRPG